MIYFRLGLLALIPITVSVVLYLFQKKTVFGKTSYWFQQAIIGVIFGLVAVCGTEFGVDIGGATANARDAAPLCAGLIFGAPSGIISGIIGGVERWFAAGWGRGTYSQVACSVSTVCAGLLAAVFCIIVLHANNSVVAVASVIGGLVTSIVIYLLGRGTSFSIGRLVLVGIGIQAMLTAFINYLMLIGKTNDIPTAMRWLSGSLNGAKIENLYPLMIAVIICVPILMVFANRLEMLELGEMAATALGVNTNKTRVVLIVLAVLILSLATAATGPIAFVSFLAGPIAKRLVGVGFSGIIPAGLIGVILVLAADLIGQFAFVTRYPVGVITGIIGAPYLIYLLIRINRKGDL